MAAERSAGVRGEAVHARTILPRIAVVVVAVLVRTGRVVGRAGWIVALVAVVACGVVRRTGRHLVVGVFDGGFRELEAFKQIVIDADVHVPREKEWHDVENDEIKEEEEQIRFSVPFVVAGSSILRVRLHRCQEEPEQIVDAVKEPDEEDVFFGFLGLLVFLASFECLERVADRTVAFECDDANVGRRTVDREKSKIDVDSAGELAEHEFVWLFERRF